jgi:hypothetical protein
MVIGRAVGLTNVHMRYFFPALPCPASSIFASSSTPLTPNIKGSGDCQHHLLNHSPSLPISVPCLAGDHTQRVLHEQAYERN